MRNPSLLLLAAVAVCSHAVAQCTALGNTPSGTNLALGDDAVRTIGLEFPFAFGGHTFTTISVCSNGFVWLGSVNAPDFAGLGADYFDNDADFTALGPRIAVAWDDWNPAGGGSVTYVGDANSASIVWKGVPRFGNIGVQANMELVLSSSGSIHLRYGPTMSVPQTSCIVGISAGLGATPTAVDWSSSLPSSLASSTQFESFAGTTFDLVGQTIALVPSAPLGTSWNASAATLTACPPRTYPPLATTPVSYGTGCPAQSIVAPSAIYERFTPTGGVNPTDLSGRSIRFVRSGTTYSTTNGPGFDNSYLTQGTPVVLGDEVVVRGLSFGAMGSFPFGSLTVGSISVCDNGYLDLQGTIGSEFAPTIDALLGTAGQGARIAPHWSDYDLTSAGAFYWSNNDPNFCMATWAGVESYSQPGTSNTFQAKLFANGDIVFSYGNVTSLLDDVIAGVSMGNNAVDPRGSDLTQAIVAPVVRNLGTIVLPLAHGAVGRAALNTAITLTARNAPVSSQFGLFVLSGTQANDDLTALGAPGCRGYVPLDVTYFAIVNGAGRFEQPLFIPPVPAFVGVTLFSQAAAFAPLNAFGVISSNGLSWTIGL